MDTIKIKREKLKETIFKLFPQDGYFNTSINSLCASKRSEPTELKRCFYKPMMVLILQGEKQTIFGEKTFNCGAWQYMISTVDIPIMSRIQKATEQEPCISIILELDNILIAQLIRETGIIQQKCENASCCSIAQSDEQLLDAFLRLTALLEKPKTEQKVLAPMIIREIHYLLLQGPLGCQLYEVNIKGSSVNQIANAIKFLKENYKEKINMADLARNVNVAPSSFYRNFKKVTTVSPLQYQKQLKLYEAQRLMLIGEANAETASIIVGYENPAHFSREYKKLFGNPPKTDIKKLTTVQ